MTPSESDPFAAESAARLIRAEQSGLRIAIACRSLVTGLALAWYVGAPVVFSGFEPRLAAVVVLLIFTAVGVAHLAVIGTRFDRWWMKYAVYTLDTLSICATFALIPISRADDVPQIIAFRAYGIYYLFPLVAICCLSLSWRLVLWTGAMCVIGWWGAFLWVTSRMDGGLSWADIPADATRADYETVFLSIDFIGRGNRIEETAMLMCAAFALAVAVYRARGVFFAQVASDLEWRQERSARERVSALFGKYVPAKIAESLIANDGPMQPQRTPGTALVMDIAGFTAFSANHPPEHVIGVLDAFLADATDVVSDQGGIVMSYLGDGFLVTFNAPIPVADPAQAAVNAAQQLLKTARAHGFGIRVGIASGDLVTGTIGSTDRQSFTVYGDAVNLAARLEGQCKTLGVPVLVDAQTQRLRRGSPHLEPYAAQRIKGLADPVPVFGLPADLQQQPVR
ncbi:adenylate/guanylate cyclase domain-containing protein [uncultured Tateyamaria sp.]|uniref:adenylate/guanylate cyclase domain-containing protein n=1 Tax=Tateyamaria sp. 1078 TaxID=3417464 RepID=UPI00260F5595|nr:adenylate/guanylate cyclase domain-containing protein [uncultured Tateyamaria sp.]